MSDSTITKSNDDVKKQGLRRRLGAIFTRPVVNLLAKTTITPNAVTFLGFLVIIAASVLAGTGHLFAAGWVALFSGYFDIIDGALARMTGKVTRFGSVFDSTLDRVSEGAILIGIMAYFLISKPQYYEWIALLCGFAILASFMVSYIRARSEGIGVDCQIGMFTRTERVIILALGLLLSSIPYVLIAVLGIIALMSTITTIQRVVHVYEHTK
jgi:CDP-diacylglycerol---glycerol-3-phosphate 3-phosphatidyltransferase